METNKFSLNIADKPSTRLKHQFDSHEFGIELHEFGAQYGKLETVEEIDRLIGFYSKKISGEFHQKKTHSDIAAKVSTTFCFLLIVVPFLVAFQNQLSLTEYGFAFYSLVLVVASLVVAFVLPGNQQNFGILAHARIKVTRLR